MNKDKINKLKKQNVLNSSNILLEENNDMTVTQNVEEEERRRTSIISMNPQSSNSHGRLSK